MARMKSNKLNNGKKLASKSLRCADKKTGRLTIAKSAMSLALLVAASTCNPQAVFAGDYVYTGNNVGPVTISDSEAAVTVTFDSTSSNANLINSAALPNLDIYLDGDPHTFSFTQDARFSPYGLFGIAGTNVQVNVVHDAPATSTWTINGFIGSDDDNAIVETFNNGGSTTMDIGQTGIITAAGTGITVTDAEGVGVDITANNNGTIIGGNRGLDLYTASGTVVVTNNGSINSGDNGLTGGIISSVNDAIHIEQEGGTTSITNDGLITSSDGQGVYVSNSGIITGDVTLTNTALVNDAGTTLLGGIISSSLDAVHIEQNGDFTGATTLGNSGAITSSDGQGIYVSNIANLDGGDVSLTNTGLLNDAGTTLLGGKIDAYLDAVHIVQSGDITGTTSIVNTGAITSSTGQGVYVSNTATAVGGTVTLTNTGLLNDAGTTLLGGIISGSTDAVHIEQNGDITGTTLIGNSGAITSSTGRGVYVSNTANAIGGAVTLTNTGLLNDAGTTLLGGIISGSTDAVHIEQSGDITGTTSIGNSGAITSSEGQGIYVSNTANAIGGGVSVTNTGLLGGEGAALLGGKINAYLDAVHIEQSGDDITGTTSIVNTGAITSSTGQGVYVSNTATTVGGGVTLTNTGLLNDAGTTLLGGIISGSTDAVHIEQSGDITGATSISNSGAITSSEGYGVYVSNNANLGGGGVSLTNTGLLDGEGATLLGGKIDAYLDAVRIVQNIGTTTITSSGAINSTNGYGIYVDNTASTGGNVTVTNTGINSSIKGHLDAININQISGTTDVNNTGLITSAIGSGILISNTGTGAVTVNNGNNGEGGALAVIAAYDNGIDISSGGAVTVSNYGSIYGVDASGNAAYDIAAGGTGVVITSADTTSVTNSGSIYSVGDGVNILQSGATGTTTVANTGSIESTNGYGVFVNSTVTDASGNVTVTNTGLDSSIKGYLDAIHIEQVSGTTGVTNTGSVTSAEGDGILVSNTGTGAVTVNNGNSGEGGALAVIAAYRDGINITSGGAVTVDNYGSIYGVDASGNADSTTAAGRYGILIGSAGTTSVTNYGSIYSTNDGINIAQTTAGITNVTNNGSITSAEGSGRGIVVNNGSGTGLVTVSNNADATINTYGNGIDISSYGGVLLNNYGSITTTGSGNTAILIQRSGGDSTITNYEGASIYSATGDAINVTNWTNGNVSVTNDGLIGLFHPAEGEGDSYYPAYYEAVGGNGIVVSYARLLNSQSYNQVEVSNSGEIYSLGNGIDISSPFPSFSRAANISVDNTGLISSGGVGVNIQAYNANSNTTVEVTNFGSIESVGDAIYISQWGGNTTITNAEGGSITTTGDNYALNVTNLTAFASGNIVVNNAGTINGPMRLQTFNTASPGIQVNNSGTWNTGGSNYFYGGDDVLNNTGTINAHGWEPTAVVDFITNEADAPVQPLTTFEFGLNNNTFNNSGILNAAGGPLGGQLDIRATNGTLTFNNFVDHLDGEGAYVSTTPGLITMVGNHVTTDSVNIFGDYNGGTHSGYLAVDAILTHGGTADQFTVNGNVTGFTHVTINDLNSGHASAYDPTGIQVVTVTGEADQGRQSFTLTNGSINKGFFNYDLYYNPGTYNEDTSSYDGRYWYLANTPNERAFELPKLAGGAQEVWYQSAYAWRDRTAEVRSALSLDTSKNPIPEAPGVWMKGFGAANSRDASNTIASASGLTGVDTGYNQNVYGLIGGADTEVLKNAQNGSLLLGVMGGYAWSSMDFDRTNSKADLNGFVIGGYASYANKGFFLDGLLKADFHDIKYKTAFNAPDATGSFSGKTYGAMVNGGYRFGADMKTEGYFIEPNAMLSVTNSSFDNFTMLNSNVKIDDGTSTKGRLGVRGGTTIVSAAKMATELYAEAAVKHEFDGKNTASLSNTSGNTISMSDDLSGTSGEVGLGANVIDIGSGLSGYVKGQYDFGNDQTSVSMQAGLRMKF